MDRITELANRYGVDEDQLAQFAEFTAKGMAARDDPAEKERWAKVSAAVRAERKRTATASRSKPTKIPGA